MLWLLCGSQQAFAQLYYKGKHLTTDDGLSDNRVTCLYKDKTGFVWIGTRNGLNRYDGHSFKIFRPTSGNSISNENINDIEGDAQGNIWVATMNGLNCYNPATGHWEVLLPAAVKTANDIPNTIVWDLWLDESGLLWMAPDVFEFCSYNTSTKKFTYYNWPAFARSTPALLGGGNYRSIKRFTQKNKHEFWLGTTKGLVSIDTRNGKFTFIGGGYYGDVSDIHYEKDAKKLLLSVQGGTLFCFDEISNRYTALATPTEPYPSVNFSNNQPDETWMSSENGLLKFYPGTGKAAIAASVPLSGSLLPGGTNVVFTDETGNRWIGTPNGITKIDFSNTSAAFLPLMAATDKDGFNQLSGVYADSATSQYMVCVTLPGAVFIIDATSGKIEKITRDRDGNTLSDCIAIKEDAKGNAWLLTRNNVYQYNRAGRWFSKFNMPTIDSPVLYRAMAQDADGNLWFGSFHGGLLFYNSAHKKFDRLGDSLAVFLENSVSSIYADNTNREVWIGTFGNNLFNYNLDSKRLTMYAETAGNKDYVALNLVNDIAADAANNIWVATHAGGILRYNRGQPFEKAFSRFDMRTGLLSNNIISMAAGTGNVTWLLSSNGLQAINSKGQVVPGNERSRLFSFSTYVKDLSIPHAIHFSKTKKELLLGVSGGLLFYYPAKKQEMQEFPLLLTALLINDSLIPFMAGQPDSEINLPQAAKTVTIKFAGLYFGNSDEIVYEYMLAGYEKTWQPARKNYQASYQNLPPGQYSFVLRARSEDGRIIANSAELNLNISPRFWQAWWFVILIAGAIITIVYLVINSLLQKLKEEEKLTAFTSSLYGQSTIDDIYWDTAQNCITLLGFTDCVVYQKEENRPVLKQMAAAGPKKPTEERQILHQMEIPVNKGIVGHVYSSGKPVISGNTSKDLRYIVDDETRLSEITVPVFIDGKVFAIIDSEHPRKNFFNRRQLRMLKKMAGICGERMARFLSEEKLRSKIARDLHDEMGSTLTSINVLSKVAMQSRHVNKDVVKYLQKIKDNSGKMMESMSDIVWAINPMNDSIEQVLIRMKEFAAELLEPARINYYFRTSGVLDKSLLNLEQRKDLYMIFKEALTNAVKYSAATEINITLTNNEHMLQLQVTDNGCGFNSSQQFSGNGLKNMHSRALAMQARLTINAIENTGTSITLQKDIT